MPEINNFDQLEISLNDSRIRVFCQNKAHFASETYKRAAAWSPIQRDLTKNLSTTKNLNDALALCLDAALSASTFEQGRLYLLVRFERTFFSSLKPVLSTAEGSLQGVCRQHIAYLNSLLSTPRERGYSLQFPQKNY